MSQTTVVNIYHNARYDVYIGRAGQGLDGYFGNPFKNESRFNNIESFRKYFYKRLKEDPEFNRRVRRLKGKVLGCFCSPKKCHGEIIAEYLNNLPDIKPIIAGVIGSRSFKDYEFMKSILKWHDISTIVSGGASGADSLASQYAKEQNIKLIEYLPNWDLYGKQAGFLRNKQIVEKSEEIIAFWDGKSKGTKHSIDLAETAGKPVHIYWPKETNWVDDLFNFGEE